MNNATENIGQSLIRDENFMLDPGVAESLQGLLQTLEKAGNTDPRLLSAIWVDTFRDLHAEGGPSRDLDKVLRALEENPSQAVILKLSTSLLSDIERTPVLARIINQRFANVREAGRLLQNIPEIFTRSHPAEILAEQMKQLSAEQQQRLRQILSGKKPEESIAPNDDSQTQGKTAEMTPEELEALNASEMVIVVRMNDLYEWLVPEIASKLRARGKNVYVQTFQPTITQEEIGVWTHQRQEILSSKTLITDETSKPTYKSSMHVGLDYLARDAARKFVMKGDELPHGGGFAEDVKDLMEIQKVFAVVMKQIVKKRMPDGVVLSLNKLADHFKLRQGGYPEDEINEAYLCVVGREMRQHDRNIPEYWAALQLTKAIEEAGVPRERIAILNRMYGKEVENVARWQGSFVLGIEDRHTKYEGLSEQLPENLGGKNLVRLQWPLENFIPDAVRAGVLEVEGDDLRQKMLEYLLEDLVETEERIRKNREEGDKK